MDRDDPAYDGQREYTPLFLRIYDPLVLGVFAPVIWRCSASHLVEGYRRHVGRRHLDVGPGTGYFLARADLPDASPVTLLDPNENVLAHASRRLRNLDVTTIEADVLKPLPVDGPFDSAALNGVLHCLPGPLPSKAAAVATGSGPRQAASCSDLRSSGPPRNTPGWGGGSSRSTTGGAPSTSRRHRGRVSATSSGASFERVELESVGTMATFAATNPRPMPSTGNTPLTF